MNRARVRQLKLSPRKVETMQTSEQVPVTVLTGFLGAGKTTLLNRILTEQHGRRYAVIVNEFGEEGIDNDLVVDADEEVFEMNNGCICCTVRGDLIRILNGLMKRADQLDAIIVETTGLADPAPVAQTFFVDQDVANLTKLDALPAKLHLEVDTTAKLKLAVCIPSHTVARAVHHTAA